MMDGEPEVPRGLQCTPGLNSVSKVTENVADQPNRELQGSKEFNLTHYTPAELTITPVRLVRSVVCPVVSAARLVHTANLVAL